MKLTSDHQNLTSLTGSTDLSTRQWQVGDLYTGINRLFLILTIEPDGFCRVLEDTGRYAYLKPVGELSRVHHTGLIYTFQNPT